jgi:hypothetical protein
MLTRILLAIFALFTGASADVAQSNEPQTKYLFMGSPVDWNIADLKGDYSYTDRKDKTWTATLTPEGQSEGKPKAVRLTVSGPGIKPESIAIDTEFAADYGTLAVYDFDPQRPTFVITNYSMGAHCCVVAMALAFDGVVLAPVDAGEYDGDAISVRDIDGDGTYEIESYDQRFYYAFDSYAGSLPARKILKIRGDKIEDVTGNSAYLHYLIGELNRRIGDCLTEQTAGICAGVLGTAARAGLFQSVAAEIAFRKITGKMEAVYLECGIEECGKQKDFRSFREALEFRLQKWGYQTKSSMNDRGREYFTRLATFRRGFGSDVKNSELGCSMGPITISMDKARQFAKIDGWEYRCKVESTNVLGNAAVGLGLCQGEGEYYSALLVLEIEKDRLTMSSIFDGAVNPNFKPMQLAACR